MNKLEEILPNSLKVNLASAEIKLLKTAPEGLLADFFTSENDGPHNAASWDAGRILRAEFLYWLCTDTEASRLVHPKGILFRGVKIRGVLDFTSAVLPRPLAMISCVMEESIILNDAQTRMLNFSMSVIKSISADSLYVHGNLFLRGVNTNGEVRLPGAHVAGQFTCIGSTFTNSVSSGYAFASDGLVVEGSMLFTNIQAKGEVRLAGAHINGTLDCTNAKFENPGGLAFNGEGLYIKGNAILRGIHASGEVKLFGANISGTLYFEKATFLNANHVAIFADGISIKGNMSLLNIKVQGEVRLPRSNVGIALDCSGSMIENPGGNAIHADGFFCKTDLLMRNITAKGEIRLIGASIAGQLACEGSHFENINATAFSLDGLSAGTLLLNNVTAHGAVRMPVANIRGPVECSSAKFENPNGIAFAADGFSVTGNIFLDNISAKGEVRFNGAQISGQFVCNGATFDNMDSVAFSAQNAKVEATFFFDNIKKIAGMVDLSHAQVGQLVDDEKSWPVLGQLKLDGFLYDALAGQDTVKNAPKRLDWIRRQKQGEFYPQPYEQLAKVFRRMGHESDSRAVLIAKQSDLCKYGKLTFWSKIWKRFLGLTIGYGYQTERIFLFILPVLLVGMFIFGWANNVGIMYPTKEIKKSTEYQAFNPFVYSVDTFVPFIDLHQKNYWLPSSTGQDSMKPEDKTARLIKKPYGFWVRIYFWLHIVLGWIFSTLAAASLTGLIRKE